MMVKLQLITQPQIQVLVSIGEFLILIQKKGPELTWNDLLEIWATERLSNGDDHILNSTIPVFEKTMIKVAMKATKGKKSEAANLLGWGRNTLARKMNELDL